MNIEISELELKRAISQQLESYIKGQLSNTSQYNPSDIKKRLDSMIESGIREAQPFIQRAISTSLQEMAGDPAFKERIKHAAIHQLSDKLAGGMNAMMIGIGKQLGADLAFREEIITEIRRRIGKES